MPPSTKRKSAPKGGGPSSKKAKSSTDDQDQYYQDVSASELADLSSGEAVMSTPGLTFQSPLEGVMRVGLMSGAILLCAPSQPEGAPDGAQAPAFTVPLKHIEQCIIIDEPGNDKSEKSIEKAHRVIIVPTAAVGASALKRALPKVISFTLPDRKAGSDFQEKSGEGAHDPEETYRGLVTRVFNEILEPHKKSVIDASSAAAAAAKKPDAKMSCEAILQPKEDSSEMPVKGKIFFLDTGILFHSQTTILYLTAESTPQFFLITNYEMPSKKRGPVNLTLVCPTSEPYYETTKGGEKGTSSQAGDNDALHISFRDIRLDMSDKISQYAERRCMEVIEVDQAWYSLKEGQPATGFMPKGMLDKMG